MTADAEHTGSKRTEELVKLAQKRLDPGQLPSLPNLRRYAALVAAAESYTLYHRREANEVFVLAYVITGHEYGMDGELDPQAVRRKHHDARQVLNQLLLKVRQADKILRELTQFYQDHRDVLPTSFREELPPALLHQCRWILSGLDVKIEAILPGVDDPGETSPIVKAARKCAAAYRKDHPQSISTGERLPVAPKSLSPFSREQLTFLWWESAIRYRGRWKDMLNLARIWGLTTAEEDLSFQSLVRKLRKKNPKTPSPTPILHAADHALFDKP